MLGPEFQNKLNTYYKENNKNIFLFIFFFLFIFLLFFFFFCFFCFCIVGYRVSVINSSQFSADAF